MFFILSKILGYLTVPSNLLVMIGLAGIALLFTRFMRAGRRLLVASVILIVAIGVLPVGTALILPLEERFPQWDPAQGTPTGIIVLGGAINPERSAARRCAGRSGVYCVTVTLPGFLAMSCRRRWSRSGMNGPVKI